MTPHKLARHVSVAAVLLSVGLSANAAEPLGVAVSGRIQPVTGECIIVANGIENSESIDYGDIAAHALTPHSNGIAVLPQKSLVTHIDCTRPVKVGMRFIDGQSGTAVVDDAIGDAINHSQGIIAIRPSDKGHLFGLGLDRDGHPIGALAYDITKLPKISYHGSDGNNYWHVDGHLLRNAEGGWSSADMAAIAPQATYSAALKRGAETPDPLFSLSLYGRIYTAIDMRPDHLTWSDDVKFQAKLIIEAVLL